MSSIIILPSDFLSSIIERISEVFRDFSPLLFLVLGIILGVYVIQVLVRTFFMRSNDSEEEFNEEADELDEEDEEGEINEDYAY